MYFLEEDELAIHTVASAVYGLLKDLKRDRGQSEAADSYCTTIFYLVRDFRRGALSAHFTGDPCLMAEIESISAQLLPITADSKLSDYQVTLTPPLERQYWNQSNRAANFLKHADRDVDEILALESIDNYLLLLKCCSAYRDIAPDDLGSEGFVFEAFSAATNPSHKVTESTFDSLVELMRQAPSNNRLGLCYKVIFEMNAS